MPETTGAALHTDASAIIAPTQFVETRLEPLLLGSGARLFDNADARQTAYECVRVVTSPSVSHYKYRLTR